MNATGVLFSFVLDAFGKSFSIFQRANDVGQAVAIADNLNVFELDELAFRHLMIKNCAEMPEVFTQNDAEEKGDAAHEREHPHELQVMRTVETANGFAQGINAIGRRKERINSLEESGQKLNGIKAGCAGDLHDDQQDGDELTHQPESGG